MSTTTRLTFLYPHLFRTARLNGGEAAATHHVPSPRNSSSSASAAAPRRRSNNAVNAPTSNAASSSAALSTSARARQTHLSKRHGKAVEPLPRHQVSKKKTPTTPTLPAASATTTPTAAVAAEPQASEPGSNQAEEKKTTEDVANKESKTKNASAAPGKAEEKAEAETRTEAASNTKDGDAQAADETRSSEPTDSSSSTLSSEDSTAAAATTTTTTVPPELQELNKDKKNTSGPMDSILHMGPPEEAAHRPPHLTPPPYVHHFDSYSLVKQLGSGGYTQAQAITAMKGVRGILAHHLDVAQEGLVSKSDVENETYLFRAACSELSAEVRNNRRVADEGMRQQRTLLQHEVDILTQTLSQELLTLNDNVRGMFNDRRMAVREEQKAAESAIQQISYKISVRLNSETKSEIEQLRWVLIRRSVLGIIFMAVLTLGTLRYASYLSHERQKEAERAAKEAEMARKFDGRHDHLLAPDAVEILSAN